MRVWDCEMEDVSMGVKMREDEELPWMSRMVGCADEVLGCEMRACKRP